MSVFICSADVYDISVKECKLALAMTAVVCLDVSFVDYFLAAVVYYVILAAVSFSLVILRSQKSSEMRYYMVIEVFMCIFTF